MKYSLVSVLATLFGSGAALEQDKPDEREWAVKAPAGATIRQVPINVDEGSWIDVDISPDGRRAGVGCAAAVFA
ncbi:amidohydrolase [Sphingorhabdus sp. SMR4y]|nr:amidohydrolase [Sphingorhabdus sp. SMR4y]